MSSFAIRVERLGKRYRLGSTGTRYRTLREALVQRLRGGARTAHAQDLWAVRDVSFEIAQGEVVGVIGRNGAGKSTLLKLLAEITCPTEGRVSIRGRVASLLEVGTGFHPELTGRENVFLNGAIMGMTRAEVKQKFDEIVAFADVERFLDTPVKRYSSGMYLRLAFAVAAHLEPEILLVDEVLAVGDLVFQQKCLGRMGEVARSGRTILFVSHNMAAVESLCPCCLLIGDGRLQRTGPTAEVIGEYVRSAGGASGTMDMATAVRVIDRARIVRGFSVQCPDGLSIRMGHPMTFMLELKTETPLPEVTVGIHVYNWMGQRVLTLHSAHQYAPRVDVTGSVQMTCRLAECQFLPGRYQVALGLTSGKDQMERFDPALSFEVMPADMFGTGRIPASNDGLFCARAEWTLDHG